MQQIKLDSQSGFYLAEPLDTWLTAGQHDFAIPEAGGSSARVFLYKHISGKTPFSRDPAFKVMRHDKISYAKPLFIEEYNILANLRGLGNLTPMLQAGFLKTDPNTTWPSEIAPLTKQMEKQGEGVNIKGDMDVYEVDEIEDVLAQIEERIQDGWLPFLILERRWEDNLYLLCDAGYTRGNFVRNLSMKQVLDIAVQICTLLEEAHGQGATFLDHKLLHYYWNEFRQKVVIIDWNIGHWQPNNFSPEVQQADMVQFSSRALHHIFTGRQAPGSVAVGPNRPEDIANSPTHFKASYSFDVQNRLNDQEIHFLEKALDGYYKNPSEMKAALQALQRKRL
jgi:serine/threonine protein kinase